MQFKEEKAYFSSGFQDAVHHGWGRHTGTSCFHLEPLESKESGLVELVWLFPFSIYSSLGHQPKRWCTPKALPL